MKKAFETPVMNISVFSVEDIITESGATSSAKASAALKSSGVEEKNIFEVLLEKF